MEPPRFARKSLRALGREEGGTQTWLLVGGLVASFLLVTGSFARMVTGLLDRVTSQLPL
jgi:hypothetical protein